MHKNLSLIFGVLAFIAILTLLLDYKIKPQVRTLDDIAEKSGLDLQQAPDFKFTDISERASSLNAHKGKTVILHFWATWCPPCLAEFPKLVTLAKENPDNLVVLAVSSDDSLTTLKRFIHRQKPPSNVHTVWDKNRAITNDLFQTFSYPETILIDPEGRMARKIVGEADWTGDEMRQLVKSLNAPLAEKTTKP